METRFSINGRKVSLLGYGAMRLPTADGGHANNWMPGGANNIDQEHLNRQIRMMLDSGINYFDTSPMYCRGNSEGSVGTALRASGYGRGSYLIATKLSNFNPLQFSLKSCQKMFENSLKALQTDYIDCYLLHSVGSGGYGVFSKRYLENGALDWCCELRKQGRIRNLGFSFHGDMKVWEWCMDHHEQYKWDFVQIQMNYVDRAEYLYGCLEKLKIPVVVMEPLLGGRLARYNWALANELKPLDPDASLAKWAFRFCGHFEGVMTVLSGMTFDSDIKENIATFSPFKRLSEKEMEAIDRATDAYLAKGTVPCTSCQYCMPCPFGIDIPALFAFRNDILSKGDEFRGKDILKAYAKAIPEPLRRAEHCTGCGRCTSHCPQAIDIPNEIAAIDARIDLIKSEVAR